MRRFWKGPGAGLALGCALALLACIGSLTQPWRALEFKAFDFFTVLAAPNHSTLPVVILAIDEPSFQQLEQKWPFPRNLHAQLIERLLADGAAAIAFDVVFADPAGEADDAALANAIARSPTKIVLASSREKVESGNATLWTNVMPLRRLLDAGAAAGDAIVDPDDDFAVRRFALRDDSFALLLAQRLGYQAKLAPVRPQYIAYRGARGTFDTRSYYQAVLPGLLPAGFFRGKIVLIGHSALTATELQGTQADLFNSPFGALGGERLLPGVELQANLLDNLITGGGLQGTPWLWSLLLAFAPVPLLAHASRRWQPAQVAAATSGWLAGLLLLSWMLFSRYSLWLAPLLPMLATAAVYGGNALLEYARALQRSRQTRAMFAQYVPPDVVDRLIAQPELMRLGGELREVTLMFTDLANFTALSEHQDAHQTVAMLSSYFDAMTPLIHRNCGTVDKFIGDAVMAFWGAPLDDARHAAHAVEAAVAMQQAMTALNANLLARGLPEVQMRIGLHSGRVVVGNVGSASRFSYTAIGDAVNLAARLEGANKAFGTAILLSHATAAQLPDGSQLRALDDIIVKGKSTPIRVYTPCDDMPLCTLGSQALDALDAHQWDQADAVLTKILAHKPHDMAALRIRQRVQALRGMAADSLDATATAVSLDKL